MNVGDPGGPDLGAGPGGDPPRLDTSPPPEDVPWRWSEAIVVFVLFYAVVFVLATAVYALVPLEIANAVVLPLSGLLLGLMTYGYVRRRHGPAARRLWGVRRVRWGDVAIGAGAGVAVFLLLNLGLRLLLGDREPPEVQQGLLEAALDPRAAPFVLLGAIVVAPVAEELFFRGLLFQALRQRLGMWPGIGVSSVIFGIAHRQDTLEGTLLLFVAFFPLGMFLAWLFHRRGSLAAPIVTHASFNAVNFLNLYVLQAGGFLDL